MKKRALKLVSILLILGLIFTSCSNKATPSPSVDASLLPSEGLPPSEGIDTKEALPLKEEHVNEYLLDITLNPDTHSLAIEQTLTYYNDTGTTLSDLYFYLYPNYFSGDGGGIDVQSFSINGAAAELTRDKDTIYYTSLAEPLQNGSTCKVTVSYTVRVPNLLNRFGYNDNTYTLGNCIITAAKYDDNGWSRHDFIQFGDPFYTDIANYNVTIHVPEGYTVAASGTPQGGGRYVASSVRDFQFCASDSYKTKTIEHEGITITAYYIEAYETAADYMLEAAKQGFTYLNDILGKYPYSNFNIVLGGLESGVGAMEYPSQILVDTDTSINDMTGWSQEDKDGAIEQLNKNVWHEIGHQWFYNIVGNDQIQEPWLDEAFCRYVEFLLLEEYYPDPERTQSTKDFALDNWAIMKGEQTDTVDPSYPYGYMKVNVSLYDFKEFPEDYGLIVYDRGADFIHLLRLEMGDEEFFHVLKDYVANFAFGEVTTEEFISYWLEQTDANIMPLINDFIDRG